MSEHISINEAAKIGVTRLRLDNWAEPTDHIEIHITDKIKGWIGPWVKFWSPTLEHLGMTNPYKTLIIEFDANDKCWTPYQGSSSIDPAGVLKEDGT